MADALAIRADDRQEYHLRATVESYETDLLIDSGFTQAGCQTGVALDEATFLVVRSRLRNLTKVEVRSLQEEPQMVESGIGRVALVGLDGSELETRIVNAGANLLGVCYFHRLPEFDVLWNLAGRTLRIVRIGA